MRPMGRGLNGNAQPFQAAQVLSGNKHGVGNGDSAVGIGRGLAGGGHGVQSDAQSAVADSVQVRVQICLEECRQEYGKRFPGRQDSAAAAAGVRFENGGGFALNGSDVGDFGGVNVHQAGSKGATFLLNILRHFLVIDAAVVYINAGAVAQGQFATALHAGQCRERVVEQSIAGNAGVKHGCDAHSRKPGQKGFISSAKIFLRTNPEQRHQRPEVRSLHHPAGGFAILVALIVMDARQGIRRVFVDASHFQRLAVHPSLCASRAVRHHGVQILSMKDGDSCGVECGIEGTGKTESEQRLGIRVGGSVIRKSGLHFGDGARADDLEFGGKQTGHASMHMAFHKARQKYPSFETNY